MLRDRLWHALLVWTVICEWSGYHLDLDPQLLAGENISLPCNTIHILSFFFPAEQGMLFIQVQAAHT